MNLDTYNKVKDSMQTGDLLLWHSNSLIGGLIRLFSRSDVNHASLVIRLDDYEGADGRRWTTEALEHGVVLNLLSRRLSGHDGWVSWLPLSDEFGTIENRQQIGRRAMQYMGIPYDYKSLFRNIARRVSADANRLFCSEYAYLCYGGTGTAPRPGDMPAMGIFGNPVRL